VAFTVILVVCLDFFAIAVILRHSRENQRTVCNFRFEWSLMYTRKPCCDKETALCCRKILYVSKFTVASRRSPCDSTVLVLIFGLVLWGRLQLDTGRFPSAR